MVKKIVSLIVILVILFLNLQLRFRINGTFNFRDIFKIGSEKVYAASWTLRYHNMFYIEGGASGMSLFYGKEGSLIKASFFEGDMSIPYEPNKTYRMEVKRETDYSYPNYETWANINHVEDYALANSYLRFDSYSNNIKYLDITIYSNNKPVMNVLDPLANSIYSESNINFIPKISVSDLDNDALTCKYYMDMESIPRETKTATGTATVQTISFSPLNVNTLTEGTHTVKFEVSDTISTLISTINFIVDSSPPIINASTITSASSSITVTESASDSIAGLADFPYRYSIGTSTHHGLIIQHICKLGFKLILNIRY